MSVKFEKETVKNAPLPGGRKEGFAHELGERLTGGDTAQGYLAVRSSKFLHAKGRDTDGHLALGLSPTASRQPTAYQDAHIWLSLGFTRISRLLDRKGWRQAWSLLKFTDTQDGRIWSFHQCTIGSFLDQYPATIVFWED